VTYAEAIQFLYSLQMFGSQFGLDRALRLAELAGNPQDQLRFIHVAGTNGKGSTCAMLESIYRAAGIRVGLYTSPHLVSFRERIQINRELISEEDIALLVIEAQRWLKEFSQDNHPTFFEVVTVMALRYFAERKCELVIWETGLGGRLDATNIVTPLASVITNVQFDHEKWLGNTLEEITREKAGIIKPGVPVVTSAIDDSVVRGIRETAERQAAPLHLVTEPTVPRALSLRGEHQQMNAALAVKTVEVLSGAMPVPATAIRVGLESVQWPGRFQILKRGAQTIILDGAHNPAGAAALAATIENQRFPSSTLIIGILEDKNWREVCQILAPLAARIVAAPVASDRKALPEDLAVACRAVNPQAEVIAVSSVVEAMAKTQLDPFLIVAGSLYLIGEVLELLGEGSEVGERALNEWSARPRRGSQP